MRTGNNFGTAILGRQRHMNSKGLKLPIANSGSRFSMNSKGSVANLIMWFGIILAIGIAAFWYFNNFLLVSKEVQMVSDDLGNLRSLLDDSCGTLNYSTKYNPLTEYGQLVVKNSEICMVSRNIGKCRVLTCETGIEKTIDLEKSKEIVIKKTGNSYSIEGI